MRTGSTGVPNEHPATEPRHDVIATLAVTTLLAAAIPLTLLAIESPAAAAGIVGSAAVALVTARTVYRRRKGGRRLTVCIPRTRVCVGV